jgi:hypothetical protein
LGIYNECIILKDFWKYVNILQSYDTKIEKGYSNTCGNCKRKDYTMLCSLVEQEEGMEEIEVKDLTTQSGHTTKASVKYSK